MDGKWNEYASTETSTVFTMRRREQGGSGKKALAASSAELCHRQRVKDMVESAKKNAEKRQSQQGERKTGLHGFY